MSSFDNNLLVMIIIINFLSFLTGSTSQSSSDHGILILHPFAHMGKGLKQTIMDYPPLLPTEVRGRLLRRA